jgi:FtsP/CotA-like multicopper oxidase with cupredoxin domain
MQRRNFLLAAGGVALNAISDVSGPMLLSAASKAEFTVRIAPISLELAAGKTIQTIAYNGTVPGPVLRMKEGKPIRVDVFNDTDVPELVHWHGQEISAEAD